MFLVQMSGVPGAGKSTIAAYIVEKYGAVSIDLDVIKTALLERGVAPSEAGGAAYAVIYAMTRSILSQGHSVVIDSPCFYDQLLQKGQEIAAGAGAEYKYIECMVGDLALVESRLRGRVTMRSQRIGMSTPPIDSLGDGEVDGEALFTDWRANMKRPDSDYLTLDTSKPLADCLAAVTEYLS